MPPEGLMKSELLLAVSAGVAMLAGLAGAQCGAVFSFEDFSSTTGLTLVGEADTLDDHLRLTRTGQGGAGAAWYTTSKAGLNAGFLTTFRAAIRNGTADGFAFVIQDAAADAIGGGGSDLGYAGIALSVAVEFDTFWCCGEFDGAHVSVQTRGVDDNSTGDNVSLAYAFVPESFMDGSSQEIAIEYTSGVLYVRLNGDPILFCPLDLGQLDNGGQLFADNGCAWVGFTAGAGAATADQLIESWDFTDWTDVSCGPLTPDQFDGPQDTPQTGDRVVFRSRVGGPGPRYYRWKREDIDLEEGPRFLGARSEVMVIDPFIPADAGAYQFGAGNDCGGFSIGSIQVGIRCPGDLNGDGFVDDADFQLFLPAYDTLLVPPADVRCDWNGDRQVDDQDFVLFLPYYDQLICP
jgi:hypothetical protein